MAFIPLALVEVESKETWHWLAELLENDLNIGARKG